MRSFPKFHIGRSCSGLRLGHSRCRPRGAHHHDLGVHFYTFALASHRRDRNDRISCLEFAPAERCMRALVHVVSRRSKRPLQPWNSSTREALYLSHRVRPPGRWPVLNRSRWPGRRQWPPKNRRRPLFLSPPGMPRDVSLSACACCKPPYGWSKNSPHTPAGARCHPRLSQLDVTFAQ